MRKDHNIHLSLRFDRETHDKLLYIAYHEGRSGNGMILHIVRQSIREFEQEHGKIELDTTRGGLTAIVSPLPV